MGTYYAKGEWNAACSSCGEEKPITEYHRHPCSKTGYRPQCKSCKNKVAAIYRINNKEAIFARNKKWRANNKARCNAATRRWRESNLDKDAKRSNDYRVRKLKSRPSWVNDEYISLWYKLSKAEEIRTGMKVHVDHIIPLRSDLVCGLHCEDNMQLLFSTSNLAKGNRHWPDMWDE